MNTQAQAKVRLEIGDIFFCFSCCVWAVQRDTQREKKACKGGTEMHLDWENDGRRRRFASLRETSIVVQKFLCTFLHPM